MLASAWRHQAEAEAASLLAVALTRGSLVCVAKEVAFLLFNCFSMAMML